MARKNTDAYGPVDYDREVPYGCIYNTDDYLTWYPPSQSRHNSARCGVDHGMPEYGWALKYNCICRKGKFKRYCILLHLLISMKDKITQIFFFLE